MKSINSLLFLVLLVILFSSCKDEMKRGTPDCLLDEITELDRLIKCDDAKAESYLFDGEIVYVFNFGTCVIDAGSPVLDQDCNTLGSLNGLVGNATINGKNFFENSEFIEVVWER